MSWARESSKPAPDQPDLVITAQLADDELPSFRAIMQAARCGLIELAGNARFLRVGIPRAATVD